MPLPDGDALEELLPLDEDELLEDEEGDGGRTISTLAVALPLPDGDALVEPLALDDDELLADEDADGVGSFATLAVALHKLPDGVAEID